MFEASDRADHADLDSFDDMPCQSPGRPTVHLSRNKVYTNRKTDTESGRTEPRSGPSYCWFIAVVCTWTALMFCVMDRNVYAFEQSF